jgi:hypothetical protein
MLSKLTVACGSFILPPVVRCYFGFRFPLATGVSRQTYADFSAVATMRSDGLLSH